MNDLPTLGTGAIPSPVDERDWTLASVGAPTIYPDACSIDQTWMIPSMQGQIGCCVGCSFEEIVRNIVFVTTGVQCNPGTPNELSWRFVYAVCKALDGAAGEGTYPSLAAKVVRTYGVPLATFCPNDISLDHETFVYNRLLANIPAAAFADALTRRSGADFTVPVTIDGIKQAINYAKANKGGVAILRRVGDSYWKGADGVNSWDKAKLLPIRTPNPVSSDHEEMLYAYDTEPGTDRVRLYWLNHWSDEWASTGGSSHDGGRGWEYADVWLPFIVEIRCSVAAVPVVPTFKYKFTKALSRGMQGADVVALQHILQLEGCFPTTQSFTGNYGDITFNGVVALQQKYATQILTPLGLVHGTGIVGDATLAWLNAKYGA
jgi:hypothetical protein